jgi:hypothetical protein
VIVVTGCASTKVTDQESPAMNGHVPRPERILVYDFAATPEDMPEEAALAGEHSPHAVPQTEEEVQAGRKLGRLIATELAAKINAMGLRAEEVPIGTPNPPPGDIVIKGYLVSTQKGSEAKRLVVGFGKGSSELKSVVEGFEVTPQGLKKLGGGTVDSGGSKSPGAALGVAGLLATHNPAGLIVSTGMKVYGEESGKSKLEGRAKATADQIAKTLKPRFQQQGWVQ